MPASVFDLVNAWEPHPVFPGYYRFGTKIGVWGFAQEDGHCFQAAELYPGTEIEQMKILNIIAFLIRTMKLYPVVMVELVRKPVLAQWMIANDYGTCSMQTVARTTPYYVVKPRRSGAWAPGLIWDGTKRRLKR